MTTILKDNDNTPPDGRLVILSPVYNDWGSTKKLLPLIDQQVKDIDVPVEVLFVDDGSSDHWQDHLSGLALGSIQRVSILRLQRNVGHQRAIALGLAYLHEADPCLGILVMDADGEDRPGDIPRLYQQFCRSKGQSVIFAERTRRSEGLVFSVFYRVYCALHRVFTGQRVRVGNFSLIPFKLVGAVVCSADLWNHYAATVYRANLPRLLMPTKRAKRLDGKSKMNFPGLVTHGLSAISVFSDIVGVRMLIFICVMMLLITAAISGVFIIKLLTSLAIPGWATYSIGLLAILLSQMMILAVVFVFIILNNRSAMTFLPLRDYHLFIREELHVFPQ